MTENPKQSRLGFVVIKFRVDGEDYFLMRKNHAWQDISFIGGHEQSRDGESLKRAAKRELLEEVPSLRSFKGIDLIPLSENVTHGPIYSKSAHCLVQYTMSFYLLHFEMDPKAVLEGIGSRSPNILVKERDLFVGHKYKIAGLFERLHEFVDGGIGSIPYSWAGDLGASLRSSRNSVLNQQDLVFGDEVRRQ